MCRWLALMIAKTLERMLHNGTGPGGFSNKESRALRVTGWTRAGSDVSKGLSVINEAFVSGRGTLIDDQNPATYIHIDDDLFLTSAAPQEEAQCDQLMETAARALKNLGFGTSSEVRDQDFDKIVGYELTHAPPLLRVPASKGFMMMEALKWLTLAPWVDVDLLRSIMGMWIWACLTSRLLLSTMSAIF